MQIDRLSVVAESLHITRSRALFQEERRVVDETTSYCTNDRCKWNPVGSGRTGEGSSPELKFPPKLRIDTNKKSNNVYLLSLANNLSEELAH